MIQLIPSSSCSLQSPSYFKLAPMQLIQFMQEQFKIFKKLKGFPSVTMANNLSHWTDLSDDRERTDRSSSSGGCDRGPGQRMESSQSSPGNIGMAATRSMGVLPDLLQQHASNTSGHQSSPQHRLQDSTISDEYRQAVGKAPPQLQHKQRSFLTFGFGDGTGPFPSPRRESHVSVNVTPTLHESSDDTPEIRKSKSTDWYREWTHAS